jgi:hypothetical protein
MRKVLLACGMASNFRYGGVRRVGGAAPAVAGVLLLATVRATFRWPLLEGDSTANANQKSEERVRRG